MRKWLLMALLLAIPLRADLPPEMFRGQVLIRNNGPQRVVVLVDSFEQGRGRDGVVDHIFILASPSDFAAPVSKLFQEAEVSVYAHAVTIECRREHIAFLLSTHATDIRFGPGMTVTQFTGDAMSHHYGRPLDLRIGTFGASCEYCIPDELDPYGGGAGATNCQAGGTNASSCSIGCGSFTGSTCSVTCSAGYACCNCSMGTASCKCVR